MDNFRPCPGGSQPEDDCRPTQSDYSCSSGKDAAASGVTDCPATPADGRPSPSLRFACGAEKFSWPKERVTRGNRLQPPATWPKCLLISIRSRFAVESQSGRKRSYIVPRGLVVGKLLPLPDSGVGNLPITPFFTGSHLAPQTRFPGHNRLVTEANFLRPPQFRLSPVGTLRSTVVVSKTKMKWR
jgi:hypothetical protein